jgi:signal peptidase I
LSGLTAKAGFSDHPDYHALIKTDSRICIKDFYREKIIPRRIAASLSTIARARNSGNAPNWSSTNSLNESSGMKLKCLPVKMKALKSQQINFKMGLFVTKDGLVYRRWVNIVPSALISGGGHFLSGRKRMGLLWFLIIICLSAIKVFFYFSPIVTNLAIFNFFNILAGIVWIVMLIESCRTPIPRLTVKAWLAYIFIAIAMLAIPFLTVRQFFFQPFGIPTWTMQPTLMGNKRTPYGLEKTGDHILVSKMAYWFHEPQRGDIVVFSTGGIEQFSIPPGEEFAKRIVGIPGDTVSIHPPDVLINGKILDDPPIFKKIASGLDGYLGYTNAMLLATDKDKIVLGKDEYLIFGDNSQNSLDGRYFGAIKRSYIKGKAILIYWPFDRKRMLE